MGKRTLFLAHTKELINQAQKTFAQLWPEVSTGLFVAEEKDKDSYVVCGSIQSVAQNIEEFRSDDFGYLVIDDERVIIRTKLEKPSKIKGLALI